MMPMLTLIIPPGWPGDRSPCAWLLRDAAGRVVQKGCSEAAHWPGVHATRTANADPGPACVVLFCGAQTAVHRVLLPRTTRGQSSDIVASALEDLVLEPANRLHFAIDPRGAADDGHTAVAVIASRRIAEVRDALTALGYSVAGAWPIAFALERASAWASGDELTVVTNTGDCVAVASAEEFDTWLTAFAASGGLPPVVPYAALAPLGDAWTSRAGGVGAKLRLQDTGKTLRLPAGTGFLRPDRDAVRPGVRWWAGLRAARNTAAVIAIALALLALMQTAWLAAESRAQTRTIETEFRRVMPTAPQVDTTLQLQREVDGLRRRHGQLAADDFLWLMTPLSASAGSLIAAREFVYEKGRLHVTAAPLDPAQRLALAERCRRAGLRVDFDNATPGTDATRFVIRWSPSS